MNLFKKYKAIAYLPTPYTLLQYYLLEPYRIEDTLFFIHERFPRDISSRMKNTFCLLGGSYIKRYYSFLIIGYYFLRNRNIPVFLGGDLAYTNLFLFRFTTIFYLEDGTGSYVFVNQKDKQMVHKKESNWSRWLWGDIYPCWGLAQNVKSIYLTGILPIPEIIAEKVKLIDLNYLWEQKSPEQKRKIWHLFMPEDFDMHLINNYETVLITQPFSEYSDGFFSEADKIEIYHRLLTGYPESKILIKTHPAETTDYSHYFPSACILTCVCPMELLLFSGLHPRRIVTVDSTAAFHFDDSVEKIIAGYGVTPALAKEAKRRGISDEKLDNYITKQSK